MFGIQIDVKQTPRMEEQQYRLLRVYRGPAAFSGIGTYRLERIPAPLCHLCGEEVAPDELAEYDGIGEEYVQGSLLHFEEDSPILAIHEACGKADNASRAETAYFGSYGA